MQYTKTLCLAALAGAAVPFATVSAQTLTLASPNAQAGGRFGTSVAAVPDVNNDGRGEMAVGAPSETVAGITAAGRVYLYSAYGLLRLTIESPSKENGGQFGLSVSGVPDVNGDLHGDIVIGAPFENPGGRPGDSGRAYLFSGATGIRRLTFDSPNPDPVGLFGLAVAGLEDVSGDGMGDVAIGAPNENPPGSPSDCGRVYIFNGLNGVLLRTLQSPNQQTSGGFGTSVAGIHDVNGDRKGDVVVGALFENPTGNPNLDRAGRAYVFSGATGALLFTLASPNQQDSGFFGNSVAGVPDTNGDGHGEVLVGAPYEAVGGAPTGSGRVYLYNGTTGALLRQFAAGAPFANDVFGFSLAGCPDLDGDGRGDLIIGAKGKTVLGSPSNAGRVYVFSGKTGAYIKGYLSPNQQAAAEFGASVAGLFNINGNGKGNVGVGAPKEDVPNFADAGRAYMFKN